MRVLLCERLVLSVFGVFFKDTEMCRVFAIEILGVIQRSDSRGVDGTPPGYLDFQRAHLMNSQCCDVKTTH